MRSRWHRATLDLNGQTLTQGTLSGFVGSETVSATGLAAALSSANAGRYTTSVSYTLVNGTNGGLASNYSLANSMGVAATINAKALTVTGTTVASKTYDGSTKASLTGGTLVGVLGSDVVSLSQAGTFASANVGTGILVTASDSLGGASVGNYSLVQPTGLTGTINAATVVVLNPASFIAKIQY